jgi:hypothetical protein
VQLQHASAKTIVRTKSPLSHTHTSALSSFTTSRLGLQKLAKKQANFFTLRLVAGFETVALEEGRKGGREEGPKGRRDEGKNKVRKQRRKKGRKAKRDGRKEGRRKGRK